MSDPLSITASVITVLQLSATAIDYLRGIKDGASNRVKLRDELRSTTYRLETLRDRIEDAEDDAAGTGGKRPFPAAVPNWEAMRLKGIPTATQLMIQVWSLPSVRYPNWSQEFPRKCSAVVLAAAFDPPAILQQMIADGHDIEGRGTDKETAPIRAAAYGHVENIRILVQLEAAVDATDYMGEELPEMDVQAFSVY